MIQKNFHKTDGHSKPVNCHPDPVEGFSPSEVILRQAQHDSSSRHSRTLLSGIYSAFKVDPRLVRSGMTVAVGILQQSQHDFKKSFLLFLLPAIFLSFFLTGCGKALQTLENLDGLKPEIISVVPKLKNIDLYGVELEFTTEVMNPYPVSVSNAQFQYSLEIMGSKFLSGETPVKTKLKASKASSFVFPVRIEFLKVSELLKDYKNIKEASYLLKGSLKFPIADKTVEIPIQKEGKFPIFHMPEFHNVKIDSTDPSFFNVGITVKADLKNTNGFALGVHGLRYAMTLGDVTVGELKINTDRSIGPGKLGKITLEGTISAAGTIISIINGEKVGTPKIETSGIIETPYGKIKVKPSDTTEE